jgi:predicted phosphate transport protein (TIGR00153 family)
MVMKRFFPKQPDFFKILSKMADLSWQTAQEFEGFLDPKNSSEAVSKKIADIEHEADDYVRDSIGILADTFITPIEREHLHALFVGTDSVIDLYHAASQRYHSYHLKTLSPETTELVKLTTDCSREFQKLIHRLDEIKSPEQIQKIIVDIHKIEKMADRKMRSSLAALYESGADVAQIFKERDMIIVLEKISDQIEDVTRLIETIVLDKT